MNQSNGIFTKLGKTKRGFGHFLNENGRKKERKKRKTSLQDAKEGIMTLRETETKTGPEPEFTESDYYTGSQSDGIVWINPNESKEAREMFDGLSVSEKKLRSLIADCYCELQNFQKAHKVYQWKVEWLSVLREIEVRQFLFKNPNLVVWESVFQRKTDRDTIMFNITFMDVYGYLLDPTLWAGRSLKFTLFLYYLFITKKYIVFVKAEQLFYQYDGKRWQIKPQSSIIEGFAGWLGQVRVRGIDKAINTTQDRELLNKFKSCLTIEKWPFCMGHNMKNGFLTMENYRYILYPHSPAFWARHVILIDIPDEILLQIPPKTLRLYLDNVTEDLLNANLFKVVMYFVLEEGSHNLIINFCGNPRGAKTLIMDSISDILGDAYKIGRLKGMNAFHREELIINARVIAFPDANPKKIDDEGIDTLKSISGRDKIHIDHKFGQVYNAKTNALIIITNNEDFDSVPAYREEAFADRVLNYVAPAIKSEAMVGELKKKLEPEGINALLLFGLTSEPEVLTKAQRSGDYNAVTGSGIEKSYIQFLLTQCVYSKGKSTIGQKLYSSYKNFLQTFDKKAKPETEKAFYKKLVHFSDKVTPKGVEKYKTNAGVAFKNLIIANPAKVNVKDEDKQFSYIGTEQIRKLLIQNSFKANHIVFKDKEGNYIKGPRLDPTFNTKMFESLEKVKNTNLKQMIEGECSLKEVKHFEATGFGGGQSIHSLKQSDFEEKRAISFQPKLQYGVREHEKITDLGNFEDSEIANYLSGKLQPMVLLPHGHPKKNPKVEGMTEDLRWLGEYQLNSNLFIYRETKPDYSAELADEKAKRIEAASLGPLHPVELVTFQPNAIPSSSEPEGETKFIPNLIVPRNDQQKETTSLVEMQRTRVKPAAGTERVGPKKRGRKKKEKTMPNSENDTELPGFSLPNPKLTEVDQYFENKHKK